MNADRAFGCIKRVVPGEIVGLVAVITGLWVFAPHLGDWKDRRVLEAENPEGYKRMYNIYSKEENRKKKKNLKRLRDAIRKD